MTSKATELERLIDAEAEHAEAHRDDSIPASAHGTRPNRARSAMFSLRLSPDELIGIQDLARSADVPASALVRGWIAQRLAAERSSPSDAVAVLDRLEADVRTLRKVVAP